MDEDRQLISLFAQKAAQIRTEVIRTIHWAQSGHPGGSLSLVDILCVLYYGVLRVDPLKPQDPDRDRLVLSKGHGAPALYCILADKGFFHPDQLRTLRTPTSLLQGHPDMKKTPGVDMSSGSLGQGLSIANGMAMAGKLDGKDYRVFAILGDGELQEGQIWEAAMTSAHYQLDNVTAIVDYNRLQLDGTVQDIMSLGDIQAKFQSFGWNALVVDGHDHGQLFHAYKLAAATKGKPTVIVAQTVKGKGVSFMEDKVEWHGQHLDKVHAVAALQELGGEVNG
jgi:transketolase